MKNKNSPELDIELSEWLEALDNVINESGTDRASKLLSTLAGRLASHGTIPTYN